MIKEALLNYIKNPQSFNLQDKLEIQAEKAAYPYCSLLQMLDILSDKASNIYEWESRFLPLVYTYMIDRQKLKTTLDKVIETPLSASPDEQHLKKEIEKKKDKKSVSVKTTQEQDVFQEINAYQEVSFRTAPKNVIVEHFLDNNHVIPIDENVEIIDLEQLEKRSLVIKPTIVSETLASVFEKQKNFVKAIEIYEQLSLKYPGKSAIFANHIERLQKIIK